MRPLIRAYQEYNEGLKQWNNNNSEEALKWKKAQWLKIGMEQRTVPAYVAQECLRPNRNINNIFHFNEDLPRNLKCSLNGNFDESWYPLKSSSSGLGFEYAISCAIVSAQASPLPLISHSYEIYESSRSDLLRLRELDKVRTEDLVQSRSNLYSSAHQPDLSRMVLC